MFKKMVWVVLLILITLGAAGCGKGTAKTSTNDVYTVNDVQKLSLVQKDAGFEIKLPASLPKDYKFQSVVYVPEQQAITVQYIWSNSDFTGEMLFLTQQVLKPEVSYAKDAKVEDVLLGNLWAKFVQGSDENGKWQNAAPVYWLRWEAHGYYFTLIHNFNETTSDGFITKEQFIKLAEQLLW